MKTTALATVVVTMLWPLMSAAQSADDDIDEVIVIGREISTDLAEVRVAHKLVVDTASVLKDIPGANVNGNGPITGIAHYRGMYGDRVSVAIDHMGVVSGGPNAMDAPLSYASPMITEQLSVERGVPGVSSAAESIGGHVSTTLSRGRFSDSRAIISGFAGTRYSTNSDGTTTAARLSYANDRHKISVVAERDDASDIETPAGTIRPSRLERDRADLSYAFRGDRFEGMLFAGRLDTTDTGTPALPMDIRYIDTDLAGGHVSAVLTDRVSIEARVAWNDVTHLMDNFSLREAPVSARQRHNLTTGSGTQAELRGTWQLSRSELLVGLSLANADHGSDIGNPNNAMFRIRNFSDVERDVSSAFIEWNRKGVRNDVELGLRAKRVSTDAGVVGADGMSGMMAANVRELADQFNAAKRDLTFRSADVVVKFAHHADSDTEWRVELASKTRAPSYQELYLWLPLQATGGLADGRSYVGGLGLDEERSAELVIGLGKKLGRLTVSPQAFYRDIEDFVQGIPSDDPVANRVSMMMSGQPALEFSNVDARIWGADVAWRYDVNDQWVVDGIATFVRGRRTDTPDNLYRLAPPNASAGFTWHPGEWTVAADVSYYAKQDKVSAYNGESPTGSFAILNAMVTWEPTDQLRLEAKVDNLFDRRYQEHLAGINRAGGSDLAVGERLYGAERTLVAGVIFSF